MLSNPLIQVGMFAVFVVLCFIAAAAARRHWKAKPPEQPTIEALHAEHIAITQRQLFHALLDQDLARANVQLLQCRLWRLEGKAVVAFDAEKWRSYADRHMHSGVVTGAPE